MAAGKNYPAYGICSERFVTVSPAAEVLRGGRKPGPLPAGRRSGMDPGLSQDCLSEAVTNPVINSALFPVVYPPSFPLQAGTQD